MISLPSLQPAQCLSQIMVRLSVAFGGEDGMRDQSTYKNLLRF